MILSVILLMVAKVAVGSATMVARHGAGHDFRFREPLRTVVADQRELAKSMFQDGGDAGKSLIAAALLSDGLSAARYEEFQLEDVLNGLDYVTSKSLRYAIPKTRYAVVLDWGFGGAGEHNLEFMLPLPTVPLKIELNEDADVSASPSREGALVGFGKMLLENELNKFAQATEGDLTKLLQGFGITPILKPRAIFLLKLALLIQHTLKTQDINFFTNELGFLLCRLVLSGDIKIPGSKDSSLSMLLPKSVVNTINKQVPALLPIVDSMFATAKKMFASVNNDEALSGLKTLTYVFNDNAEAAKAFETFAVTILDCEDSNEKLEEFLAAKKMQSADWDDFCELYNQTGVTTGCVKTSLNFVVGKMVSYGNDVSALIGTNLLTAAQAAELGKAGTVYTLTKDKFTIVCCRTDKAFFDISQTFSALAASVAKAWGLYMVAMRNEVAQGHDLDTNELLLDDVRERKILRKFLKSEQGRSLSERLEQALQAARNPFEKMRLKHSQVERELNALEQKQVELAKIIDEKKAARTALTKRSNQKGLAKVIAELDVTIDALRENKSALDIQVAALEKEFEYLEEQVNGNVLDAKRLEINDLMQVLQGQYAAGQGIDADLRSRVEDLQRELAADQETAVALQAQTKLSDEEKLDLRASVLDVYKQELAQVTKELANISVNERFDAEVLTRLSELEVYKKFLAARVARMQDQQVGLGKLMAYRSAIKQGVMLATERETEFYDLERTLSFVLESNNPVDICRIIRVQPSIAKRFIQEIAQPARGSAFEPMHQNFIKSLSTIMARSTFAQENAVMVKYVLSMFFPAAQGKVLEQILMQGARA